MKRKMKKAIAMGLALSICFNTASMNAFAQEQTTEVSTEVSAELQTEMQTETQTETEIEKTNEASTETNTTVSGNDIIEDIPEGNWDGVTTESVYEGDNFKVTFLLTGHWEGGYSAKVKIENTGDSVIENWGLKFGYSDTISELSNAVIDTQENEIFVIKNAGWNQNIAIGASAEFSFSGKQNFSWFPERI